MIGRLVMQLSKSFAAIVAALFFILGPVPAQSGEAELELLTSYVGNWRGESVLVGSDNSDPFRCRLTVTKGNQEKINYAGRCTLITTTLSVSGTIAYFDEKNRYEGVMSSNAGFTGLAIGLQQGDTISFDLREQQKDRGGSEVRIGARLLLVGDSITVNFEVEFNNSGKVLTADVPFTR